MNNLRTSLKRWIAKHLKVSVSNIIEEHGKLNLESRRVTIEQAEKKYLEK